MTAENNPNEVGKMIGIDLGTTNTVAAYMKGVDPDVLFNRDGKPLTRSVVSLRKKKRPGAEDEAQVLVGNPAVRNLPMAPEDTIISIKRLMGIGYDSPEIEKIRTNFQYQIVKPSTGMEDAVRVVMGGKEYLPEDISAMILRTVKEDAEERLGEKVTHAVITVPAYFSQSQKAATLRAGVKAGLKVLKLLDEPTAAAIAYGVDEADTGEFKRVVVYDLGGGTFDVSVLMWGGMAFVPMNIEGDMWLGGDNFDQEVVNYVVQWVKKEYGIDPSNNHRFMGTLKLAAQEAKEALSYQDSAEIIIPNLLMDEDGLPMDVMVDLTRERYEDMIRPYVTRSLELVEKAIENANLTLDDIDYILMAGNASMTPLVDEMVTAMFGKDRVLKRKHPKHCVAEGAAIVAKVYNSVMCPNPECGHANDLNASECAKCGTILNKLICPQCEAGNEPGAIVCAKCGADLSEISESEAVKGGVVLGGISSRHYGVQCNGDEFAIFIHKNDPIPTTAPVSQKFVTTSADQRMIYVPVFGGDHTERASLNERQGDVFANLPPGLPKGTEITISLGLDGSEVFRMSAELEDGTVLDPWNADHAAVESLEALNAEIANHSGKMRDETKEVVEDAYDEVVEKLQQGNVEEAKQDVEDLQNMLKDNDQDPSLDEKARVMLNLSEFIINEYAWVIGPAQVSILKDLQQALASALEARDVSQIRQALENLEHGIDNLPDIFRVLFGLKIQISQLEESNPADSIRLKDMLAEAERELKRDPEAGMQKLVQVIQALEKLPPAPAEICQFPGCGLPIAPGAFMCPAGHPTIKQKNITG